MIAQDMDTPENLVRRVLRSAGYGFSPDEKIPVEKVFEMMVALEKHVILENKYLHSVIVAWNNTVPPQPIVMSADAFEAFKKVQKGERND